MVVGVDLVLVDLISTLNGFIHALEINQLVKVPRVRFLKRILVFVAGLSNLLFHITLRSMVENEVLTSLTISVEVHAGLLKFHEVSQQLGLPLELLFSRGFQVIQCFLLFFHLINSFLQELLVSGQSLFVSPNLLMSYVMINVFEVYSIFLKNCHRFQLRKLFQLFVNIRMCAPREYFEFS